MKTNVKYLNTQYHINPNKGKVHCLLEFGIDMSKIPGIDYISYMVKYDEFIERLTNKYTGIAEFDGFSSDGPYGMLKFKANGLASCNPNDNFDVAIGKKISNTRAQKESFLIARSVYDEILNIVESFYKPLCDIYINCNQVIADCKAHEFNLINN